MTVNLSSFPTNVYLTPTDPTAQGWPNWYVVLSTLFFSMIIAIGLFGNSLILATLARFRGEMQTPCNLLIGNICAADLAVCVIVAPLRMIEIYRGWIFGDVMCYVLAPLQDVFIVVSVFSQTLIALERHRAIVAPFKSKNTLNGVKKAVSSSGLRLTWRLVYPCLSLLRTHCTIMGIITAFLSSQVTVIESHTRCILWYCS